MKLLKSLLSTAVIAFAVSFTGCDSDEELTFATPEEREAYEVISRVFDQVPSGEFSWRYCKPFTSPDGYEWTSESYRLEFGNDYRCVFFAINDWSPLADTIIVRRDGEYIDRKLMTKKQALQHLEVAADHSLWYRGHRVISIGPVETIRPYVPYYPFIIVKLCKETDLDELRTVAKELNGQVVTVAYRFPNASFVFDYTCVYLPYEASSNLFYAANYIFEHVDCEWTEISGGGDIVDILPSRVDDLLDL